MEKRPQAQLIGQGGHPGLQVAHAEEPARELEVLGPCQLRVQEGVVTGHAEQHSGLPRLVAELQPADADQALRNAGRALQEGGVQAVKLEGGQRSAETVRRIVEVGIPVMGHVGLTPQSVHAFGGYRAQGRKKEEAVELVRDAESLQEAGALAVVLELIPGALGRLITKRFDIPTIGIGAGPHCDGQVQVFHDILGLFTDFMPKHVRRYAEGFQTFKSALEQFINDTRSSAFPSEDEDLSMDESIIEEIEEALT